MKFKKWSHEDLLTHIKANFKFDYSTAIIIGALYKKLYGTYPKLGLSGFQAEAIDTVVKHMPEASIK